ncbi:MAG: hypothetical protein HUU35_18750, partial [Armatimonadetes bacterium]|nr:hypothetical protein [Armatimonadota bacterium]
PATPPLDLSGEVTTSALGPLHPSGTYQPREARATSPLVYDHGLGQGRVRFVAAPVELEPAEVTARAYAELVTWLGAERLAVTPNLPEIHAFAIPLRDGGRRYLIWNEGPAREISINDPRGPRQAQVGERTWALL